MIDLDDIPLAARPLFAQVRHLFASHLRHFAGRPRAGADLLHLGEVVDRLGELAPRVTDVPVLRAALAPRLAVLRDELAACFAARYAPRPDVDRARALAELTNQQFVLYRRLFAGRPRLTRRRELLQRIYMNLTAIQHEMGHIDAAALPSADDQRWNAELLAREIARLQDEERALFAERQRASRDELIRQFGVDVTAETVAYQRAVAHRDRQGVE